MTNNPGTLTVEFTPSQFAVVIAALEFKIDHYLVLARNEKNENLVKLFEETADGYSAVKGMMINRSFEA